MQTFGSKRYRTFDYEMKRLYGSKVIKLSLDAGFSCPNRQNGLGGCIFCTPEGSGEFSGDPENRSASVSEQIRIQKSRLSQKWTSNKYIASFQSFTNTFAPVDVLKAKYDEALLEEGVIGLSISTRPDCLGDDVINLLKSYQCPLWLELGLQSVTCHKKLNRGYENGVFVDAARRLKENNIPFAAHIIFGLPWESFEDTLNTVRFAVQNGVFALKLHMLYIDKTTALGHLYEKAPFPMLTFEEYVDEITEAIAIIPPEIAIHRVTGDGNQKNLIAPLWTKDKRRVLNEIDKMMIQKNYFQGCKLLNITE